MASSGRFSLVKDASKLQSGGEPPDNGDMDAIDDLKAAIVEIKADARAAAAELRAAIAESKSDIIKWLSGAIFAAVAILLSAMFFLAGQIAKPISQPQPIVIQLPATSGVPSVTATTPSTVQVK